MLAPTRGSSVSKPTVLSGERHMVWRKGHNQPKLRDGNSLPLDCGLTAVRLACAWGEEGMGNLTELPHPQFSPPRCPPL